MISEDELKKIPLLSALSSEELVRLGTVLREKLIKKNAHIVHEEEPSTSILFLVEGKAKVTLSSTDGKEVILTYLEPGDFFGEIALLTGSTRSANVVANENSKVLILSGEDFNKHITQHPGLSYALARELAFRLRAASMKIGDLALYDVYRRLARTLKTLGKPEENEGETVYIIEKRPTHQEFASLIGTSREMVTRALHDLELNGCIETEDKKIIVKKLPL